MTRGDIKGIERPMKAAWHHGGTWYDPWLKPIVTGPSVVIVFV